MGKRVMYVVSSSGKQLFETDHNLDTSDIQFLEDGKQLRAFCFAINWFVGHTGESIFNTDTKLPSSCICSF